MDPTSQTTPAIGEEVTPLSYATPSSASGSPIAAGVWITLAGLALVFFGGCFCIGILLMVINPITAAPPLPRVLLMLVLYGCVFACFATGGYVIFLGLRKLLAVGR